MSAAMRELTGRHVLMWLVGFFGIVLAVNVVFVYLALDSFTGVETEQPYLKGLAYNETLKEADAQQALGWEVSLSRDVLGPRHWRIVATFVGADGHEVTGLDVRLGLRRPASDSYDVTLELLPDGTGRYVSDHVFSLEGQWDLRLVASTGGNPIYRQEQRAWVR